MTETVNLGMYTESDPEKTAYPNLFTLKCPFSILDITRVHKSVMKSICGGGGGPEGGLRTIMLATVNKRLT